MSYDNLISIIADDVQAVEEMEIPRRKLDKIINENTKLEQISQWEQENLRKYDELHDLLIVRSIACHRLYSELEANAQKDRNCSIQPLVN